MYEIDFRWKIRARCFSKGPIRPLPMCSFDFVDASGEIRAVAFRDECTRFHPIVEVDKVYHFFVFPFVDIFIDPRSMICWVFE